MYDMCVTSCRDRIELISFSFFVFFFYFTLFISSKYKNAHNMENRKLNKHLLVNKIDRYLVSCLFMWALMKFRVSNDKICATFFFSLVVLPLLSHRKWNEARNLHDFYMFGPGKGQTNDKKLFFFILNWWINFWFFCF